MYRSVKFPVALTGTGSILAARRLPLRETVTKYGVYVVHGLPGQGLPCPVGASSCRLWLHWQLVEATHRQPRDATHGESMLVRNDPSRVCPGPSLVIKVN